MPAPLPRYAPERPLPPYAFTRGITPHPRTDPTGHSYGAAQLPVSPLDPDRWRESAEYRFGIDLFNHGYYWEAHEAWEALWIACGRCGTQGGFLKGLIKLAAAALKLRMGQPVGGRRHAHHAAEHLAGVAREIPSASYAGLDLENLVAMARRLEEAAGQLAEPPEHLVSPLVLKGDESEPQRLQ